MGKRAREPEPAAQERTLGAAGAGLAIAGRIEAPGRLEGGDVVWIDDRTLVVGRGYRTNGAGIRQLRALLGDAVEVIEVPLPHWRGESDVMHLMSLISPVDNDLAVVYSRLIPVPFREWLLERGLRLVETPDEEFETMGTNVLALAPRRCVMLSGSPRTRAALEAAGAEVIEYEGAEISVKGAGGPTCLTRPITRLR
jgi:N-dimethylarginine dimethylaminohydrolase